MIARISRKNGARLTRPLTASTNFSNGPRPSVFLRSAAASRVSMP